MEYLRGTCKPTNDLPLWTDDILLCKLQKQHRAWHKQDRKLVLNQERIWTVISLIPQEPSKCCNRINFWVAWESWWIEESCIMWSLVLNLPVRWNPTENHSSLCWALSRFLNTIYVHLDQPQCGKNPLQPLLLSPMVLILSVTVFLFSRVFIIL